MWMLTEGMFNAMLGHSGLHTYSGSLVLCPVVFVSWYVLKKSSRNSSCNAFRQKTENSVERKTISMLNLSYKSV